MHLKQTYNKKNLPTLPGAPLRGSFPHIPNLPNSHHSGGRATLDANLTSNISEQFLLLPPPPLVKIP